MSDPVSVVVPARNEAETIESVVQSLAPLPWVEEIVVVDNNSEDNTAEIASKSGARTVFEPIPGMGSALRAGFKAAKNSWCMKVDADLDGFDIARFTRMVEARVPGVGVVKGAWQDPNDNMPMTRLLVMPAMAALAPKISHLRSANSGIYLANRDLIAHQELVDSYAADLDVMLRTYAAGAGVVEADIGQISHDTRDVGHYNAMAEKIMAFFLQVYESRPTEELIVVAETAEQVVQSVLGLIATRAKAGAIAQIFVQDLGSVASTKLTEALAPYPTTSVSSLAGAEPIINKGPDGRLVAFAETAALLQTRGLESMINALEGETFLFDDGLSADASFDIEKGAGIKRSLSSAIGAKSTSSGVYERFTRVIK